MDKEKKLIPATYLGCTPEECEHIIVSYLEYTNYQELIWDAGYKNFLEPFPDWWNEYISDEAEGLFLKIEENKDE
jgi:hypothetical protein